MIITGAGKPDRYLGAAIQADAFQMFGVVPTIGRWFRMEENEPSAEPVVMLGYDLWQQRYAANPGVVGKDGRGQWHDGDDHRRHAKRMAFSGRRGSLDAVAV